eukprot:5256341-Amphidinium_carterae.1
MVPVLDEFISQPKQVQNNYTTRTNRIDDQNAYSKTQVFTQNPIKQVKTQDGTFPRRHGANSG